MTIEEVALPDLSGIDLVDAKQMVRSILRARRSKMTAKEVEDYALALTDTIIEFAADAKTIAMYVSVKSEPGTRHALEALHSRGCRILLPKLGPGLARMWAEYSGDDLEVQAPGRPPSPKGEPVPSEAVEEADAIIVPGLAIDKSGMRLGQGGGLYDLILKQDVTENVAALIYPWEYVAEPLPHDDQDVHVPWALTPTGKIRTSYL